MAEVPERKQHPRGLAGTIWGLEHVQDLVSVVVGVLLAALAAVVLVQGIVDFFHDVATQPLLAVGLVAVIRKILFVLSSEETVSTAELALLIAMIAVFVAALILVSRYDRTDG